MSSGTGGSKGAAADHHLSRQLGLRDLVFSQVLTVVGSAWVGLAAGLGRAQTVVWLLAMSAFYMPMAVAVYFLNREMPLEGGLYSWTRRAFGDTLGFLVAWNIWAYGLTSIAALFSELPSGFAYMAGPRAAWIPENHALVLSVLAALLVLLALAAWRGLALGKWLHNVSGAAMMLAFALLIAAPFWAKLHGQPVHYQPGQFHLPARSLRSLALIGQILFASSGLEYVAIMAGETKSPTRNIGRSVIIASPIVVVMFILGTGSVLAFHEMTGTAINYVAPIPQTLALAFSGGAGTWLARFAILLILVRILGCTSFLFTGATRLPMAAGWDDLIPAWFSRLDTRFRTPVNSILVGALVIAGFLVLDFAGARAAEAFASLNNASNALYGLAYVAMFAIPLVGSKLVRARLPLWMKCTSALGMAATIFTIVIAAYPFLKVSHPGAFAAKFAATLAITNLLGYAFYRVRRARVTSSASAPSAHRR